MNNSIFVFSENDQVVILNKLHLCIWEFLDKDSLIEIGLEISEDCIKGKSHLDISLYMPFFNKSFKVVDLYERLLNPVNSRFIFNENIDQTFSLDGGMNREGVVHTFSNGLSLGILPFTHQCENNFIHLKIDLEKYLKFTGVPNKNPYFRLMIECPKDVFLNKLSGINKSSIVYDFKLNQKRNLPEILLKELKSKNICKINTCYFVNIIPSTYVASQNDESIKSIRSLEYDSFVTYLGEGKRIDKNSMILFHKKNGENGVNFFSIFNDEIIGTNQVAVAVVTNLVCGFLLALPEIRKCSGCKTASDVFYSIDIEIYLVVIIMISLFIYLLRPFNQAIKRGRAVLSLSFNSKTKAVKK